MNPARNTPLRDHRVCMATIDEVAAFNPIHPIGNSLINPLTPVVSKVTWSLHKLMGIYIGDLVLGVTL